MLLLSIIILVSVLLMLFHSQPVREFSFFKWIMIVASIALTALCVIEIIQS